MQDLHKNNKGSGPSFHKTTIAISAYADIMVLMKNITQLFKALSEPTRIRIVWLLQAGGELCVCDLVEVLDLPQSTVSRHLAYLRNAGLVDDQRKGVWMYYRLPEKMNDLLAEIMGVLLSSSKVTNQAASDHQRLKKYLETKRADRCGSTGTK